VILVEEDDELEDTDDEDELTEVLVAKAAPVDVFRSAIQFPAPVFPHDPDALVSTEAIRPHSKPPDVVRLSILTIEPLASAPIALPLVVVSFLTLLPFEPSIRQFSLTVVEASASITNPLSNPLFGMAITPNSITTAITKLKKIFLIEIYLFLNILLL
jgi:hypothetical protein